MYNIIKFIVNIFNFEFFFIKINILYVLNIYLIIYKFDNINKIFVFV